MKPQQKDYDKKKIQLKKRKYLSIRFKYMYDQLLKASDNARGVAFSTH